MLKNKTSNIKRMGVKSIHYNKNNIIIENSFSKNTEYMFDAEYDDIYSLKNLKSLKSNPNVKNNITFKDITNEKGFALSKSLNKENLISIVRSVKNKKSYVQDILNITDENNIEIQIYQNYEDIRKLIAIACGRVFYSVNSIASIDFQEIDNSKFDKIGTISVKTEFKNYRSSSGSKNEINQLIESMKKVFKRFGIALRTTKNKKCGANKAYKGANYSEEKDEIKDNLLIYDYLRMFSAIRNFSIHGNLTKEACDVLPELSNIAQKDLESFGNKFVSNNIKYKKILEMVYSDANIFYEFFDYSVYTSIKNLGVSIEKIRKYVMESIPENKHIAPRDRPEYFNKFRVVLGFALCKSIKAKNIESIIQELKEARDEYQKEGIYKKLATQFVEDEYRLIENIKFAVSKNLGKVFSENMNINLASKMMSIKDNCENGFFNMLYVFSKLLTKQEANSFFANITKKVESIENLVLLAKTHGIAINENHFKNFENIMPINSNFEKLQNQLKLLKSLRANKQSEQNKSQKESINYKTAFNAFDNRLYTYEQLENDINIASERTEREKPLKQFIRNNIVDSKSYKYLISVTDTRICPKIMKHRELVKLAIYSMLGITEKDVTTGVIVVSKDKEAMLKYLKTVWFDYCGKPYSEYDKLTYPSLFDLMGVVSGLNFDDISHSLFQKSERNYLPLVRLYFNICYLIVKGLMVQNTSYFIAFEDLEKYKRLIGQKSDTSVVEHFVSNSTNKTSRSYNHLMSLVDKQDYIKNYYKKQEYLNLFNAYRNCVMHCSLLSNLDIFNEDIKDVTSYFALYQILIQRWLKAKKKNELDYVWGKEFNNYFKLNTNKSYSTKLTIALNIPFAYNMARFNNLTIEKYAVKNKH